MAKDHTPAVAAVEALGAELAKVRESVAARFIGQEGVIDLVLAALLCGGHALIVGLPGLGKTRLVETLSVVMGLQTSRIQFTPDLMPADILGAEVLDSNAEGQRHFRFIKGPVFCQLLMADEINRASPRTQSALLQAMQEKAVTVAGVHHDLPSPFHVLATQNPLEHEGTYPLPEAQLDRFLLQIDVTYPSRDAERAVLLATTGAAEAPARPVMNAARLMAAQQLLRALPVGEAVVEAILDLVRLCRPGEAEAAPWTEALAWGPGPRAAQALMLAVRARALLAGRLAPNLADVAALAVPVLSHRMALTFAARARGEDLTALIQSAAAQASHGAQAA